MRIQIQLKQICEKLPYEEFSGDEKNLTKLLKSLKTMERIQNYYYSCNKMPISTYFLAFFSVFFLNISFLDPDPYRYIECDPDQGGKMIADSNPQPWLRQRRQGVGIPIFPSSWSTGITYSGRKKYKS